MRQLFLLTNILLAVILVSCGESPELSTAEITALRYIPEHWDVGITTEGIYRPSGIYVVPILIGEQYVVVLTVDNTTKEIVVSPEVFNTLSVGDLVMYNKSRRTIDEKSE